MLTERERQIVHHLSYGLTNIEIGDHLLISPLTVKQHLVTISVKLGARGRAGIVGAAYRAGLMASWWSPEGVAVRVRE